MNATECPTVSVSNARVLSGRSVIRVRVILATLLCWAGSAGASLFFTSNLVTDDQTAHPAVITDANLVNAWGISSSASSPFWVSSNEKGLAVLYRVDPVTNAPTKVGLEVTIPGAGNPTGQAFANVAGNFNGDLFLFVSEDGTVSGWRNALGTNAETLVLASPLNSYKGSALATIAGNAYLYAADFAGAQIDVYKGNAAAPDLAGSFTDPGIPAGFAPFNIQKIGNELYVTYALVGPTGDDVAGLGNGFVSVFDLQGNFLGRVASQGTLDSPWGVALAPASFRQFAGDLLVGNFGDGHINVFDPSTHDFLGQLLGFDGNPLEIEGLWGLTPGNGGNGGSPQAIYFSAGPDDEGHGLFGVLAAPEPGTIGLMSIALAGFGAVVRRRKSG